jgi:hypothetical protein
MTKNHLTGFSRTPCGREVEQGELSKFNYNILIAHLIFECSLSPKTSKIMTAVFLID